MAAGDGSGLHWGRAESVTGGMLDLLSGGGLLEAWTLPAVLEGYTALVFLILGGAITAGLPIAISLGLEISLNRIFMLTLFFLWPPETAFEASILMILLGALFPGRGRDRLILYLVPGLAAAAAMRGAMILCPLASHDLSGTACAVASIPAMLLLDVVSPELFPRSLTGPFTVRSGRTVITYIAILPITLVTSLMVMQAGDFGALLAAAGVTAFSLLCRSIDRRFQSSRSKIDAITDQSRLASLLVASTSSSGFIGTLENFLGCRQGDVLLLGRLSGDRDWTAWSSSGQSAIPTVTMAGEPPQRSGDSTSMTVDGRRGYALALQDGGEQVLFTRGAAQSVAEALPRNLVDNLVLLVRHSWEAVGHTMKSERSFLAAAVLLARLADSKDDYTHGHSIRVSSLSCGLGERLGLSSDVMRTLRVGAILHDLGKLAIPAEILTKKGLLTRQERELVQNHPGEGAKIVSGLTGYEEVTRIIRSHHERLDGNGYPDGLAGSDIPFLARIVAVADTFDAITSTRTYHTITGRDTAMETIRAGRGVQYDARVVDALDAMVEEGLVTPDD